MMGKRSLITMRRLGQPKSKKKNAETYSLYHGCSIDEARKSCQRSYWDDEACYYDGEKSLQSWEIVDLVEKEWDIRSLTSNRQLASLLDFLQGNADRTAKKVSALFKSGCKEIWL